MLVLSRKPNESILIGKDVRVTVVDIYRNQVRLGIEAPEHITVLREELRVPSDDLGEPTDPPEIESSKAGARVALDLGLEGSGVPPDRSEAKAPA
jgi:carbon storage regulator